MELTVRLEAVSAPDPAARRPGRRRQIRWESGGGQRAGAGGAGAAAPDGAGGGCGGAGGADAGGAGGGCEEEAVYGSGKGAGSVAGIGGGGGGRAGGSSPASAPPQPDTTPTRRSPATCDRPRMARNLNICGRVRRDRSGRFVDVEGPLVGSHERPRVTPFSTSGRGAGSRATATALDERQMAHDPE